MNPHPQPGPRAKSKTLPKSLVFGGLLLAMFVSLMALAPGSRATREALTLRRSEAPALNTEKRRRAEFVPGDVLVRFKKNLAFEGSTYVTVPDESSKAQAETKGAGSANLASPQEQILVRVERFDGSNIVDGLRIAHVTPTDTLKAIAALQARVDVMYAEPNYIVRADRTPNDPLFTPQLMYGLQKISAPQAWDTVTGNSSVAVGIVDEGIDVNHPDLQANIWLNPGEIPGNGLDDDNNGFVDDIRGWDFVHNDNSVFDYTPATFPPPAGYVGDRDDHGTHVAGTIGAVGDNLTGVVGVNWQVKLISLKFIRSVIKVVNGQSIEVFEGSDSDALRAYNYAKQMRTLWLTSGGTQGANIRALNNSYGGGGFSLAVSDGINALSQSGIMFVAAAGNNNTNNDVLPYYPAGYTSPNVIAVTATNSSDQQLYNYGLHTVAMGAPGFGILSTTPRNTYTSNNGTSMATPHVTGAAALLCAANPNLTVNQLRALLAFNGDVIPALQGKTLTGRRLNVFKSLQALSENDTTPPGTVSNFGIASQNGRTINLSWTASGDDGPVGQAALYDLSFVDQFTGALVPLVPVAAAPSGSQQTLTVNIPYRHTAGRIQLREFDNVGNEGTPATLPVTVDRQLADPYATSLSPPAALSTGGTALGLTFDDCYKENYALPSGFTFPFFGQSFTSVTISTNGNLFFSPPPKRNNPDCSTGGLADDVPSSVNDLSQFKMIAGMWDDLDLSTSRRADADVYVVPLPNASNPDRVIFRWQGVQFGDGTNGAPINFEIELNVNGTIKTRYGSGNTNLFPVVGISGGEPDPYVANSLTSELSPLSLTNAQGAVFTPRTLVALPTVQFNSPTATVNESTGSITLTVTRTGDTTSSSSVSFATSDTAGAQNCVVSNGPASSRCDYATTARTLQFGPGDTSRTLSIPIIDDTYAELGETFTVSLSNPSGASLVAPSTTTVTINDNDGTGGSTPIGDTDFFIRQQYLDFLNREPDVAGFNFWKSGITSCGGNPQCIEVKRIDTSAAFFLSIEFQGTGYLVERLYKTAYGDVDGPSGTGGPHMLKVPIVRLNEFLPDTQKIGQGVIVNQGNWQQQLEDNKQAFIEEFIGRLAFTTAYPLSMSPGTFVDTLNTKAGNVLSTAERDQLVNELMGGVKTRAQVLRAVAEDPDLVSAEFNRAFVLMQYFGYLRRNPNDLQDTDYAGYEFWLGKLNQFGNYVNAQMVKAFLDSAEYKHRFGP